MRLRSFTLCISVLALGAASTARARDIDVDPASFRASLSDLHRPVGDAP